VAATVARAWTYERPTSLSPGQLRGLFCQERYGLVEGSTKSGKSSGAMIWLAEQTFPLRAGQSTWWVSPVRGQAKVIYERIQHALPRAVYRLNDSELRITLDNDASIWFKGAERPDLLYGDDVFAAVVDEASRMREQAWHAIRSTLSATRGCVRIIGNVKGRKNWFYKLARQAEGGAAAMHYAKLTSMDAIAAGILDAAEVKDAKEKLPRAVYQELYEAIPSDDEGNPFGFDAIRACVVPALSTRPVSAWGWDLAKSSTFTVGVGLDDDGCVAAFHRWQKPWLECIQDIQRITGDVPALVDETGVGSPIVEALQDGETGSYEGLKFTPSSKQSLMDGLAIAIKQQTVRYPPGPIQDELETFEYQYTRTGVIYSAPEGLFDDCVMALGLARKKLGSVETHAPDEWMRIFRTMERGKVLEKDPDLGIRTFDDDIDERHRF
jgi:hypothetical protein